MGKSYQLILIDRDGVINKKALAHNYIVSWKDFMFLPRVKEAFKLLNKSYYKIAIVTDQIAIGKGLMSLLDFENISENMLKEIKNAGGRVDKIYFCPHKKEDCCDCRKPSPKNVLEAIKHFNATPKTTVYLGDFFRDYETAKNAGCDFIWINEESDEREKTLKEFRDANVNPKTFKSLYDAALFLTK